MDCSGARNAVLGGHRAMLSELVRGYVRRAPGRLGSTRWSAGTRRMTASGTRARRDAGPLEAFLPGRVRSVARKGLGRVRVRRLGSGSLVLARPTGARWSLRLTGR